MFRAQEDNISLKSCIEVLESVYHEYGYDFRNYNRETLTRRMSRFMRMVDAKGPEELWTMLLEDKETFANFVRHLSITVTSMFRDPEVFKFLREHVLPTLNDLPYIRVWAAGVASGEEAYSMAILLKEEGFEKRSLIYATDFNPYVLKSAIEGRYPLEKMPEYTTNYLATGGREEFSNYYRTTARSVEMRSEIRDNIVFSIHDLVNNEIFNRFHLILCRNVSIYFNEALSNKVVTKFHQSLHDGCYLCLGTKESVDHYPIGKYFTEIDERYSVYEKIMTIEGDGS